MSSVDVIVPCYNYGEYLARCVDSVLRQPSVSVRVLILDDASNDMSPDVGRELAARDTRVEFRRHTTNQGHIATYNEGIAWANGDYLLLLSADDLLTDGALQRAAAVMDAHSDIALTFGRTLTFADGETLPSIPLADADGPPQKLSGHEFVECACNGDFPLPVSVLVRTEVQKRIGGWRFDLPHAADPEMWLRFAAHGAVGRLASYQGYYRRHRQNMSSYYESRPLLNWEQNNLAFHIFFTNYGERIADIDRLKELRARNAAEVAVWRALQAFDQRRLAEAQKWLEAVSQFYPKVTSWPSFARLVWKMRLGYWPSAMVGRALQLMRSGRRGLRRGDKSCVDCSH